jgi:hypothetical protein
MHPKSTPGLSSALGVDLDRNAGRRQEANIRVAFTLEEDDARLLVAWAKDEDRSVASICRHIVRQAIQMRKNSAVG